MNRTILAASAAVAFLLASSAAEAATCFWVGGTGTWSTTNAASWSNATGGTASTCAATGGVPKQAGDVATFDGSSGGGTVTVDSTINGVTMAQIVAGAFTGTLDFSVNNPSMTLSSALILTGSATRTIKLGSGTFTLTGASGNILDLTTVTGLTLTATSTTIVVNNSAATGLRNVLLNNQSIGTLTLNAGPGGFFRTSINGPGTIGTLNVSAPNCVAVGNSGFTVSTALNINGTSSSNAVSLLALDTTLTLTLSGTASINWAAIGGFTFTGSPTATNSFDMGKNSGITITGPSGGGGGHIIGG